MGIAFAHQDIHHGPPWSDARGTEPSQEGRPGRREGEPGRRGKKSRATTVGNGRHGPGDQHVAHFAEHRAGSLRVESRGIPKMPIGEASTHLGGQQQRELAATLPSFHGKEHPCRRLIARDQVGAPKPRRLYPNRRPEHDGERLRSVIRAELTEAGEASEVLSRKLRTGPVLHAEPRRATCSHRRLRSTKKTGRPSPITV